MEYRGICDATGVSQLWPGDVVVCKGVKGLYLAAVRTAYFEYNADFKIVGESVEVKKLGDESRTLRKLSPSACLKTFAHYGRIFAPCGYHEEIDPKKVGDEILAFSIGRKQHLIVQFVGVASPGNYLIRDGERPETFKIHRSLCFADATVL